MNIKTEIKTEGLVATVTRDQVVKNEVEDLSMSVIVAAHNAEKTLEKCLQAIHSSIYKPIEVIVVDDASTDKTGEIASRYKVKLLSLKSNVGQGKAKNTASKFTKGNIFVFVDSDIIVAKDTFGIIAECFQRIPDAGAVTGCLDGNAPVKGFFSRYKNRYMEFIFSRLPDRVDFLFTSIAAIRRTTFLPFAESRMKADDTDLGFRLSGEGTQIIFSPHLKVQHLKEYSFSSFIRNEFKIPYDWAQIFLRKHGLEALIKKGRFAHASFSQIIGLFLASATAILLIAAGMGQSNILVPVFGIVAILALNYRFLKYIAKNEGIKFALAGTVVTFFDPIIMSIGIGAGFCTFIMKSVKEFRFNRLTKNSSEDLKREIR